MFFSFFSRLNPDATTTTLNPTILHEDIPQENVQALRSINKNIPPNSVPRATPDEIYHVDTLTDPETQKEVVLWDDILQAFKHAEQVRHQTRVVPFLKGGDLRILEPRRIAAIPNTVLDVIVGSTVAASRVTFSRAQPLQSPPEPPPTYESTIRVDIASSQIIRPASPSLSLFNVSCIEGSSVRQTPVYDHGVIRPTSPSLSLFNVSCIEGSSVRQAPVYDHGEAMIHSSSAINRSHSVAPPVRVPQVELHQQSRTTGLNGRQSVGNSITTEPQSRGGRQSATVHTSTTTTTPAERVLVQTTHCAKRGDKTAQATLGDMYSAGMGVPQDYKLAMHWYLKAADQGYREVQHRIGNMYAFGHGVNKNHSKAMEWHLKAAKKGYPESQDFIGGHYYGVALSFEKAMDWYHRAAYQRHAPSEYHIGLLYNFGRGVTLDYVEAMVWYMKAAKQMHAESQYRIGFLYQRGQGVARDYVEAEEWYSKAAFQGNRFAKDALIDLWNLGVFGQ